MRSRNPLTSRIALIRGASLVATTAPPRQLPPGAGVVTHVNGCWSSDNGGGILDSVEFSPSTDDVTAGPATVEVSVDAHDTGLGYTADHDQSTLAEYMRLVPGRSLLLCCLEGQ